jgi:peptide/nickel transport system substrate-binding protein
LAGIQVQLAPLPPGPYYNTGVGDPTNDYALILAGWVPDWANGSAIIPPLFAGSGIPALDPVTRHAAGNVNWPLLNDATINGLIDDALKETQPERQATLWGDLDEKIQQQAVDIPLLYERAIRLTGSNVLGGFITPAFGMPDLVALGLAQP